ncbi:hypothetical protein D9758_016882 [Tetrapyrgos nigripes]|uniref:Uncharacterized protein n=1 Tax=Tetrapyrgos nigripes TaxID=182062 RepID=A0A8H5C0C0_9AGAR|nr:hypothetical protein D9758_016882 [Tetrapyrgos nigripes]
MSPINLTQGLVPWDQLEGLANISGVGMHMTTFEWDQAGNGGVGVQLEFGEVFHTVKAWINGVQIPTTDPTNPVVDVSAFVKQGTNDIRVDAASTLLNAFNSVSVSFIATLGIFSQLMDDFRLAQLLLVLVNRELSLHQLINTMDWWLP